MYPEADNMDHCCMEPEGAGDPARGAPLALAPSAPSKGPTCLRAVGLKCWAPLTCDGSACPRASLRT